MGAEEKILVIRGGAIGDFILTLPAIAALRKKFPQVPVEILGHPRSANLAVATGLAEQVRSLDDPRLAGFFSLHGNLDGEFAKYFSTFSLAVSYLFDPEKIFAKNFACCSKAKFLAGPHRPDEKIKLHATKVFLQPLEHLGIFNADGAPILSLNSQPSTLNFLALHPGSGSERKNWPEEKWAELIRLLIEKTDFRLLFVGGEAEGDRLQRLSKNVSPDRVSLAQNLPLVELARKMKSCAAFLGHDSRISHLAAALDLPGVILWGETNEEIWRPPSGKLALLRHAKGIKEISVAAVFAALPKTFSVAGLI